MLNAMLWADLHLEVVGSFHLPKNSEVRSFELRRDHSVSKASDELDGTCCNQSSGYRYCCCPGWTGPFTVTIVSHLKKAKVHREERVLSSHFSSDHFGF